MTTTPTPASQPSPASICALCIGTGRSGFCACSICNGTGRVEQPSPARSDMLEAERERIQRLAELHFYAPHANSMDERLFRFAKGLQASGPAESAPAEHPSECDCCKDIRDAEAIYGDGPAESTPSGESINESVDFQAALVDLLVCVKNGGHISVQTEKVEALTAIIDARRATAGTTAPARQNWELVVARLEQIRDGSAEPETREMAMQALVCAQAVAGTAAAPSSDDARDAARYRLLRDAEKVPGQVWAALESGEGVDEAMDLFATIVTPIAMCEPCKAGRYTECEYVLPCTLPADTKEGERK